jgi:hypothetical protein
MGPAPFKTVKFALSQSRRRSVYDYILARKRVFFGLRVHLVISHRQCSASG